MATRYSVRGLRESGGVVEWVGIALLSDDAMNVKDNLYLLGMAFLDSSPKEIISVQILDLENGEILWDSEEGVDYDDDNCDDDCGFDPYMGCYTDDC